MVTESIPVQAGEPFKFEWSVDKAGYEVQIEQPRAPRARSAAQRLILGREGEPTIVRKGGPLVAYRPLEDAPGLFIEFANLPEDPGAMAVFAGRYGLLGIDRWGGEYPSSETFSQWRRARRAMRQMVSCIEERRPRLQPSAEAPLLFNKLVQAPMTVHFDIEPRTLKPVLRVVPFDLLSAMWLQVAAQITRGVQFRKCKLESCPRWFPIGRGPGQRERREFSVRREFCSDSCRVMWHHTRERKEAAK